MHKKIDVIQTVVKDSRESERNCYKLTSNKALHLFLIFNIKVYFTIYPQ